MIALTATGHSQRVGRVRHLSPSPAAPDPDRLRSHLDGPPVVDFILALGR